MLTRQHIVEWLDERIGKYLPNWRLIGQKQLILRWFDGLNTRVVKDALIKAGITGVSCSRRISTRLAARIKMIARLQGRHILELGDFVRITDSRIVDLRRTFCEFPSTRVVR